MEDIVPNNKSFQAITKVQGDSLKAHELSIYDKYKKKITCINTE
jgi:hypothetical protein